MGQHVVSILEIAIVLNLAATSTEPSLVEGVIQFREPAGEYLFHVAFDSEAVITANAKQSILRKLFSPKVSEAPTVHGNDYKVLHEVSVKFKESATGLAQEYIDEAVKKEFLLSH